MNVYIISDTHFNEGGIETYCVRPENYTRTIITNWRRTVRPEDVVIHLGDVFIGNHDDWSKVYPLLPGRKILVRGNHDRKRSLLWWMENGFDVATDGMAFREVWLSHEPVNYLPVGCKLNIHGHLHNIWHGFHPSGSRTPSRLFKPWQRLFAVEYTNYQPVQFQKFLDHAAKYQATGKAGK
jgi:calcineurin-like phosphoesterase family protein